MPDSFAGPRRILARRYKILTPQGGLALPVDNITFGSTWSGYSPEGYDYVPLENSNVSYWKTTDQQNFLDYHFRTWDGVGVPPSNTQWKVSMVRRPDIANARTLRYDAMQKLYMLPDVGEFKIDPWYEYEQKWGIIPPPMAIYWNISDIDGFIMNKQPIDSLDWYSEIDIGTFIAFLYGLSQPVDIWPQAIRFTFTLYDKDRRHFPDGKTFTYMVKLPER